MTLSPRMSAIAALSGLLVALAGGYFYYQQYRSLSETRAALASVTQQAATLQASLASTAQERDTLQDALTAEQGKNRSFETQISQLSGTVGKLDQLAKTDPQLLAKYSKVYFLNENYVPSSLSDIDPKYLYDARRTIQIHGQVVNHLYAMLDAAHANGIDLLIASGYRSFGTQAALKSGYKVTYGAGTANSFSADQGYSEHQLGTALDFTTSKSGGALAGFEKSDAYAWLAANAYQYGFILSYPKGNAYYQYEPWHWRFVGIDLAAKLHAEGQNFYDLDQREINGYLISIFD